MATKQARGTKRTCQSCDERFYDLDKSPIICPHCGAKYVIASSPAALAALQAEEKAARSKAKKTQLAEDNDSELAEVEGEEALADVETEDDAGGDADETFLEEEEEEGGDMSNIIGGGKGEDDEA